ncbi:MAG: dehydrogenase, partial [Cyclobacteriaceae bacterium]
QEGCSRKSVLSGFGTGDTHHLIHTFRWGPEGMMYFNQSIYIYSHIETPWGIRRLEGGGVWQFRPETLELDVYARGLVNPWGNQFNRWGQSFLTDGAGYEGINYAFPGATFLLAPGAERILQGLNPGQPKHSGLDVVSGRHLPESWEGNLITNDFRANRINRFVLKEQGSGYVSEQAEDLLWTDHIAFRPVDITVGPDGAVYVADWYNPIIQHGEVDFQDERRDHQHGRIWRITAKDRPLVNPPQLTEASTNALLEALKLPEEWTRTQAKQLLKNRGVEEVLPALKAWVANLETEDEEYEHHLLEALWVHQSLGVVNEELLHELLEAENHHARAAATRTLYYWYNKVDDAFALLKNAVVDTHPQVRLEAVIALRKLQTAEAATSALAVLEYPMDEFLDFALWQTIRELEPFWMPKLKADPGFLGDSKKTAFALKSVSDPEAMNILIQLYQKGEVPEEYNADVLNAMAASGTTEDLNILLDLAVNGTSIQGNSQAAHLGALEEAVRQREAKPDREPERIAHFTESEDEAVALSAVRLIGYWKLAEFQQQLVTLAQTGKKNMVKAALGALASMDDSTSRHLLTDLTGANSSPALRLMATAELVSLDASQAANLALAVLKNLPKPEDASDLFAAFVSRKEGTQALAEVLNEQTIPEEVAKIGRQTMQQRLPWFRNNDDDVKLLAQALEASGGALPPERMPQQLSDLEINNLELEVKTTADPQIGETIFRRNALNCMTCHAIGGAGGLIGPDLSSLGTSMPTVGIIRSLLAPNESIKEGYELQRVVKNDGSVVMGYLTRKTSSEVVIRNVTGEEVVIPASQIDVHENVSGSLMPPGLTASLEREEFINLVGFLSKIGVSGDFRVPSAQFVRRWRALTNNEEVTTNIRENGPDYAVGEDAKKYLQPVYSKVSGELPLEELPVIEVNSKQHYSLVQFDVEVLSKGNVSLFLNTTAGITAWVDQTPVSLSEHGIVAELPEGIHQFTIAIEQGEYGDKALQVQLQEAENAPAQTRLVVGQ